MVKSLIPDDVELDEQVRIRMSNINIEDVEPEAMVLQLLKESVATQLHNAIMNYRHSKHRIKKMRNWLDRDIYSQDTAKKALAQLADMVSVLALRPQFIHHHSPFVSLNKQLCEHLGKFLPIDKLGVRQSLPRDIHQKIRQMPILGAAKVFEIFEGSSMMKILFNNSVFIRETDMISMQNAKMRTENQFPMNVLMIVAPQEYRDALRKNFKFIAS